MAILADTDGDVASSFIACREEPDAVTLPLTVAFFAVVFLTSALSGIFGMAGGLILLGCLLLALPASVAIVVHGVIQLASNGSRAWLSRQYIAPRIVALIASGGAVSAVALAWLDYHPDVTIVSLLIGVMPVLVWIPRRWFHFDASRPGHALACGVIAGGLTIAAGVSGPTIDLFFIRTGMDRRQIVATKAAVQVIAHAIKIIFYAGSALALSAGQWGAIALAVPVAFLGTRAGNGVLRRLSNAHFRYWTRWIVTVVGAVYLVQGLMAL
ncbi:sulfite exporter TauE/SafE family protein [Modicisalibacter tunisiensis]|uniref:sulfite exporter TauE/SafE family protein n=1 Tax=Modicisalibacter tunisiensis TaxID=390637 RepID=UPI001CCBCB5A|nr:sulfite exporter TauE/SafE family protein [Modicisalibacter tunisiensis]